jgi:hypothetical protein
MAPNKERAKRVILEIIRQSGGSIGKTKLFKTFWLAHLYYSKKARGFLTDWPIVRMPRGPGIDKADRLIDELIESGNVTRSHEPKGPFMEITCRLTDAPLDSDISPAATEAIREAVEAVRGHTAESISELSHDDSRSWRNAPNGTELDIYSDLIPDDVYEERAAELAEMKKAYEDLFK